MMRTPHVFCLVLGAISCAPEGGARIDGGVDAGPVLLPQFAHSSWMDPRPHAILEGSIAEPGERDVFAFHAPSGAWMAIEAKASTLELPFWTMWPVIRLYDPAGALIATSYRVPRARSDEPPTARIIAPALAQGLYYVEVDDILSSSPMPRFGPNVTYHLAVAVSDTGLPAGVQGIEETADAAPQIARTPNLVGWIDEPGDVDVIAFEVTGGGGRALGVYVPGPTEEGGGGAALESLRITDASGVHTFASLEGERLRDPHGVRVAAPLPAGRYLVRVEGGASTTHYVLMEEAGDDFVAREPWEPEGAENDDPTSATPANVHSFNPNITWFVTFLDAPGDRDWYSVDLAPSTRQLWVSCNAEQTGSAATAVSIRIQDPSGAPLSYLSEGVAHGAVSGVLEVLDVPSGGRYRVGVFGRIAEPGRPAYVLCDLLAL